MKSHSERQEFEEEAIKGDESERLLEDSNTSTKQVLF